MAKPKTIIIQLAINLKCHFINLFSEAKHGNNKEGKTYELVKEILKVCREELNQLIFPGKKHSIWKDLFRNLILASEVAAITLQLSRTLIIEDQLKQL